MISSFGRGFDSLQLHPIQKLAGSIKNLRVFLFAENLFIKKKTKTFGY